MAVNALDEKIIQIRLKNEEIKRRYEEVEADKKNAAKLNALVQMVPSSDWPERKEPPEFIRKETNKSNVKPKPIKDHTERLQQYLIGGAEGKKIHKFAQGDGPPPDPKYNFLADSEREENNLEAKRDEEKHKGPNKYVRNGPRKRGSGRDGYQKEHRKVPTGSRDGALPEYDAWRAERNRIDEARINRQRTAEGNWRREWDNDKVSMEKESSKKDPRFQSGDSGRRDYKEFEKRHQFDAEHSNRTRGGGHRNPFGPKSHNHYDNHHYDYQNEFSEGAVKGSLSPLDDRTVIATDKSIKVTVNHGSTPVKGPVMSVKVNAPSIAGTGRVGPRQKTRITYSSQSEAEVSAHHIENFSRQKSFDEKIHFNNTQRGIAPKSPFASRRKENSSKSPFLQRKDTKRDEQSMRTHGENILKSPSPQKKKIKDAQKSPVPPQAQMQFFTSSSQGLVSSRGRGQKRLNEAKGTVIKILGRNADNCERTMQKCEEIAEGEIAGDLMVEDVIATNEILTSESSDVMNSVEKSSKTFSDINVNDNDTENTKNHTESINVDNELEIKIINENVINESETLNQTKVNICQIEDENVPEIENENVPKIVAENVSQIKDENVSQIKDANIPVEQENVSQIKDANISMKQNASQIKHENISQIEQENVSKIEENVSQIKNASEIKDDVPQLKQENASQIKDPNNSQIIHENISQNNEEASQSKNKIFTQENVSQITQGNVSQLKDENVLEITQEKVSENKDTNLFEKGQTTETEKREIAKSGRNETENANNETRNDSNQIKNNSIGTKINSNEAKNENTETENENSETKDGNNETKNENNETKIDNYTKNDNNETKNDENETESTDKITEKAKESENPHNLISQEIEKGTTAEQKTLTNEDVCSTESNEVKDENTTASKLQNSGNLDILEINYETFDDRVSEKVSAENSHEASSVSSDI